MAAPLTLPEPVVKALKVIADLSDESFDELRQALQAIPLKINPIGIVIYDNFKLNSVSAEDTETLKDALVPIYMARVRNDVLIAEYTENVIDSLKQTNVEWSQNDEIANRLRARLGVLLSIDKLNTVIRAFDVLMAHPHTYSKARVLSDIRPVLAEQGAEAAVVVHTLSITYYRSGERQTFAVALDSTDIKKLAEIFRKAEEANKSLEAIISATNMPYIEVV